MGSLWMEQTKTQNESPWRTSATQNNIYDDTVFARQNTWLHFSVMFNCELSVNTGSILELSVKMIQL